MELDKKLIKEFASAMKPPANKNKDTKVYGTISKFEDDTPYVILDGSDLETPAEASVAVKIGDRVVVQRRNHKAYISDNFTAPPDGRLGDKYFYFDPNRGLIIGRIDPDTHMASGNYVLITDADYRICDEDGNVLAIFADANIDLGANSSTAKIYFCDRNGNISYSNDRLVLEGDEATGIKSENLIGSVSQVAVIANDDQLAGAMSILRPNGVIDGQVAVEWEEGKGTRVRLSGYDLSFKGNNDSSYNTVLVSNNLICTGTATIKGSLAVNKGRRYSVRVSVPTGYTLAGIREVSTNHTVAIVMTGFGTNPSNNTVFADMKNVSIHGTTYSVTVTIEWFAFRTNSTASGESVDINLDGDGGDE